MQLRPYQRESVDAVYRYLREKGGNPCVVLPTAAGKSLVLAQIASDAVTKWNGRVLILAHVKELLEQNADKVRALQPDLDVGVYSAGLNRRDTQHPVIVAGIQSVYQKADVLGRFDLIITDESHMIPPDGEGRYQAFLRDAKLVNPHVRLIGLTATPYRMKSGMICGPDNLLTDVCHEVGVRELIDQGFLCLLKSKAGRRKADFSGLHIRAGEFVASEVESVMDDDETVLAACREIVELTRDRNSVLIFCASVGHAEHVAATIEKITGQECGILTGDTSRGERADLLARFKGEKRPGRLFEEDTQPLQFLVNVNVLTTGFDAPNIDCVVLLRPTASPGLFYQMVGRGFRLHESKQDCLVLDYGENVLRHGPVDAIQVKSRTRGMGEAPVKECPECQALIAAGCRVCPECEYEFPPAEKSRHEEQASSEGVLSGEVVDTEYEVMDVFYSVHRKRGAEEGAPRTMRVDYRVGFNDYKSEWVCIEHDGWARSRAEKWWASRSHEPCPTDAVQAVAIAENRGLAPVSGVTVRKVTGEKFDRITSYELGEKPDAIDADVRQEANWDDVPF